MGFKNNAYATLWANKKTQKVVDLHEKYAELQLTTSKKNQATGKLETDFSGKVRFIGKAFEQVSKLLLQEKDRLKLLEVETTNKYDATTKTTYTNFVCWDFECIDNVKPNNNVEVVGELPSFDDNVSETLPF